MRFDSCQESQDFLDKYKKLAYKSCLRILKMICRTLQIASIQDWMEKSAWLKARTESTEDVEDSVREILKNVKQDGDAALIEYTRKYDCPAFENPIQVSEREIAMGAASVPAEARRQISAAAANIRAFHESQLERSWFITKPDGTILGQRVLPMEQAGLYVPGGKGGDTPLISSLLMNAIPAQVAGCRRIAVVSPPREDGTLNPCLLATAHLLDIEEVYRVGGAWSIAALAYGTQSIPSCDVIAGPGNIYVSTAKRILQGQIGIDMIAGPSEILILADGSANPAWIAADMLSQAEHDVLASAICLTDNARIAEGVAAEIERQLPLLPRKEIAAKSLADWGCIAVAPRAAIAIGIANCIAPEHLELCMRDPWTILPMLTHAGAIFMGQHSPEPVGDYFAGPNHVLPTLGTARFSSGLSVQTFCKKTNIIAASRGFLKENAADIAALARMEGLEAHARSVEIRSSSVGFSG